MSEPQRQRILTVDDRQAAAASLRQTRERLSGMWTSLDGRGRPESGWAYYAILICVVMLTGIGLMMVLSASAVESISQDRSSVSLFAKQALWAAVGFGLMFLLSRLDVSTFRKLAWPGYGLAIVLLILVLTPLGVEVNGNKNWIQIKGFTMQPSEPAKLALCIWTAFFLERKRRWLGVTSQTAVPVLIMGGVIVGLVLAGRDLGTSLVLGAILLTAIWASGMKKRIVGFLLAGGAVLAGVMSIASSNRSDRISAWLGSCDDSTGLCDQAQAGLTALARGGWTGVGLGQSQVKWSWLPEAHNDFIFAIVGEELGLLGTVLIIVLFGVLALVSIRVILRYDDVFIRVSGSCIVVWVGLQAIINISMVVGLLPVIGIPLPFISYGGSALTFTLTAMGILLSYARCAPRKAIGSPAPDTERTAVS